MKIFSGSSNKLLAGKIARNLGLEISPIEVHIFPDGERRIKLNEDVVDQDAVVVQSTAAPVDQNYVELFFIVDALKRSGARSVTVVVPYLGYQRQDHIFRTGEAVSLQVMVKILESIEVDRVIALDLHSIKIPEFFHIPLVHISALPLFAEEIQNVILSESEALPAGRQGSKKDSSAASQNDNSILVSPDMGGLRRIQKISSLLDDMPWIATVKDRDLATGDIDIAKIDFFESGLHESDLKGKYAFLVDDMASSGKTLVQSANLLRKNGVSEIYAFVTHPIFSEDAPKLLQESIIEKVFVTDSVFIPEEKKFEKLEVLSVAEMIAGEIKDQK
jgi:ribose-phosphate pyrophosphokinase